MTDDQRALNNDLKKIHKIKIAVIGLGYVGLPLAVQAASRGYDVTGIDIDKNKIKLVNNSSSPINDTDLAKALTKVKITATSDFKTIKDCEIVIICVPTPVYENRHPNYKPLTGAVENLAPYITSDTLIILESTVNPGVCEEVVIPLIKKHTILNTDDILLAHCPERINPGDPKWKVSNIPRVVGANNTKSLDRATKFYESILDASIKKMGSLKEAEAVKVVENSFRNINIAFVNELAQSFDRLGIDVINVINGAATKPFAFIPHFPGCGVGGHCIPVDPYYLIDYAKKNGYSHRFLSLACKVNEEMPEYTVSLLKQELKKVGIKLNGSKIAILGLSYKANIDDTRESPAIRIVDLLEKSKARVSSYDPYVNGQANSKSLEEALSGAAAVILAANHKEFSNLNPDNLLKNNIEILIDGRNFLNKQEFINAGIHYRGIGV